MSDEKAIRERASPPPPSPLSLSLQQSNLSTDAHGYIVRSRKHLCLPLLLMECYIAATLVVGVLSKIEKFP